MDLKEETIDNDDDDMLRAHTSIWLTRFSRLEAMGHYIYTATCNQVSLHFLPFAFEDYETAISLDYCGNGGL